MKKYVVTCEGYSREVEASSPNAARMVFFTKEEESDWLFDLACAEDWLTVSVREVGQTEKAIFKVKPMLSTRYKVKECSA